MKFINHYCLKQFRKQRLLSVLACLVVSLITVLIIITANSGAMMSKTNENYNRVYAGKADISLKINQLSINNFFGISQVENDPILKDKGEVTYSFFNILAPVKIEQDTFFAEIIVVNFADLQQHNSLSFIGEQVYDIGRNDIIIADSFAKKYNLKVEQQIPISFQSQQNYYIRGVAKNKGMFSLQSPIEEKIIMTPAAFSRIMPLYISGVVNNAFIKVKEKKNIKPLVEHFQNADYDFQANTVLDPLGEQHMNALTKVPLLMASSSALVFSFIFLFIILSLFYRKIDYDLVILKVCGLRDRQKWLIYLCLATYIFVTSTLISLIGLEVIVLMLNRVQYGQGVSIHPLTIMLSLLAVFLTIILPIILKTAKKLFKYNLQIFIGLIIALSLIVIINGGFIYLVPLLILILCIILAWQSGLIRIIIKKERRQHQLGAMLIFFTLALSIVSLNYQNSTSLNRQLNDVTQSQVFDIVISNLGADRERIYQVVADLPEVKSVFRSYYYTALGVTNDRNQSSSATVMIIDINAKNELFPFISDEEFNRGAVIGKNLAIRNNFHQNENISFTIRDETYQCPISAINSSEYNAGLFVIINKEDYNFRSISFTQLLIIANNDIKTTINTIFSALQGSNVLLLDAQAITATMVANSVAFTTILNLISIITLISILFTFFLISYFLHSKNRLDNYQFFLQGIRQRRIIFAYLAVITLLLLAGLSVAFPVSWLIQLSASFIASKSRAFYVSSVSLPLLAVIVMIAFLLSQVVNYILAKLFSYKDKIIV